MAQRQTKATNRPEAIRNGRLTERTTPPPLPYASKASSQHTENGSMPSDMKTRIEKLAYELYERRGAQDGHDWQDWLEAERHATSSR
ncbi:MAG: hypothetical protein K0S45_2856 [Nitrospira sp.]|jgi:hypothetical protein|nr:hypothetical protein [Nitrospira sp.]